MPTGRIPEAVAGEQTRSMPTSPDRFLLTGCASGIGRHLADVLIARGHRVWATDIDLAGLRSHAAEAGWPEERVRSERLDVCDPAAWNRQVAAVVAAWGGIDVVLNIAGYIRPSRAAQATDEDVHRHFDVNVKGVVFGTRAAAEVMIAQGAGHIINIASLASLAPVPGISLYSASKYAVRAFSLAAAQELRPSGSRGHRSLSGRGGDPDARQAAPLPRGGVDLLRPSGAGRGGPFTSHLGPRPEAPAVVRSDTQVAGLDGAAGGPLAGLGAFLGVDHGAAGIASAESTPGVEVAA